MRTDATSRNIVGPNNVGSVYMGLKSVYTQGTNIIGLISEVLIPRLLSKGLTSGGLYSEILCSEGVYQKAMPLA